MKKSNCWEFMKCGREKRGTHADDLGICPASSESSLNGKNSGKNGGRACWVIAGTCCNGNVQGTFVYKMRDCLACDFYKTVIKEEGPKFTGTNALLDLL